MKTSKYIILTFCLVLLLSFPDAYTQDLDMTVTKTLLDPAYANFEACDSMDFVYTLTVNESRQNIEIKEDFPEYCFEDLKLITPLSANASLVPCPIVNPFQVFNTVVNSVHYTTFTYCIGDIMVINNSVVQMQFIVRAYSRSDGMFFQCDQCGSEPYKLAAGPLYNNIFQPGDNDPAVTSMTGSGTSSGWDLSIAHVAIVSGEHCITYKVELKSGCPDFNLNEVRLMFTAPPHSEIYAISPVSSVIVNSPPGTLPNIIMFTLNPSMVVHYCTHVIWITVLYPCGPYFPDPPIIPNFYTTTLTVKVKNIINFNNGADYLPYSPFDCDGISLTDIDLGSDSFSHVPEPVNTDASIIKYNSWPTGHDGVGCENQYVIDFANTGNTVLEVETITDDPLPSNIEVINICETTDLWYRLNNSGPWIDASATGNQLNSNILAQVTGIQWKYNPPFELFPPDFMRFHICYRIKNVPTVNDKNKVIAKFSDKLDCTAPGCPGISSQNYSRDFTFYPGNSYSNSPGIYKTVCNGPVFHHKDEVEFCIVVMNSGEAPLSCGVLDQLPQGLFGIHNVNFSELRATENPYTCSNGAPVTYPFSYIPDPLQIELKVTNLVVPGICVTKNNIPPPPCCMPLYNAFIIKFNALIDTCQESGPLTNTAFLTGTLLSFPVTFLVAPEQVREVQKLVKGQVDPDFATTGQTYPGGIIDYKIKIYNTGNEVWKDPIIVDRLPYFNDHSLCTNQQRDSEYNVWFRNGMPVTYSIYNNSGASTVAFSQVVYANGTTCDPNCCNACFTTQPSYHSIIQFNTGNTANDDNSVKILFSGELACGDSIIVNIACKADATALPYQWSFNDVCVNALDRFGNPVDPNIPPLVAVQILGWEADCCEETNFDIVLLNQQVTWTNTNPLLNAVFHFETPPGSTIAIQEFKMTIVGFTYEQDYEDCFRCKNDAEILGTFNNQPTALNGLVQFSGPQGNRERKWGAGTDYPLGVPSSFSPAITIPVSINLPAPRDIPCCGGCVKLVIKFEATDTDCMTCERYLILPLLIPWPIVYPNNSCGNTNN